MLYHGPVWVPNEARAGDAKVVVEFPAKSPFRCFPTALPVMIVAGANPG